MKRTLMATLAVLLAATMLWALDDTPENRDQQADRYMQASPVKEMLDEMAVQMAKNLPADQRQLFKDLMTKHIDVPALEAAIKKAMVKHFSADELKALADFYGSPVGRSAMKKFGAYMADVMPVIQNEVLKANAKANRERAEKAAPQE